MARNDDTRANEVAMCQSGGELWLAWSRATLAEEVVHLGRCHGDTIAVVETLGSAVFRPRLARLGDGVALGACAVDGEAPLLGRIVDGPDGDRRFEVASEGRVFGLAMAGDDHGVWIACEEWRGAAARIRLLRLGPDGRARSVATLEGRDFWYRSPALAIGAGGAWLGWIEGPARAAGKVRIARIEDNAIGEAIAPGSGVDPDAPALAVGGREVFVAWHELSSDGVLRWIRVAAIDLDSHEVVALDPPADRPASREAAGPNQGWELPAIGLADDGALWLAGRSSHGFQLSLRAQSGPWMLRLELSPTADWGGRGRGIAVAPQGANVLVARREPAGIEIERLSR